MQERLMEAEGELQAAESYKASTKALHAEISELQNQLMDANTELEALQDGGATDGAKEKDKAIKIQFMGEVAELQSQLMATEDREAKLKATVGCLGEELAALQTELMQASPRA